MPYDLGIADRLRAYGLDPVEIDGWQTRGSSHFSPQGYCWHHTAGARSGNAPSLGVCINGRRDLPGPLCNVFQARDNTIYVVAAGRANHAGRGGWRGLSGNSSVFGLEVENVGTSAEPWREDQIHTMCLVAAALLDGRPVELACRHGEWAPRRKVDTHMPPPGPELRDRARALSSAGTPILGEPHSSVAQAQAWARARGGTRTFIALAPKYWKLSQKHGGVRPDVAYAQSAKETGFGKFGGVIDASYKNPCGMKKAEGGGNYDPEAHQRFGSWDEGIAAHLDHLALYGGADGFPRSATSDPRHFPSIHGKAKTVEALGGKWAPAADYGISIIRNYLSGFVSEEPVEEDTEEDDMAINSYRVTGDKAGVYPLGIITANGTKWEGYKLHSVVEVAGTSPDAQAEVVLVPHNEPIESGVQLASVSGDGTSVGSPKDHGLAVLVVDRGSAYGELREIFVPRR